MLQLFLRKLAVNATVSEKAGLVTIGTAVEISMQNKKPINKKLQDFTK